MRLSQRPRGFPCISVSILAVIIIGCLISDLFIPYDPSRMDPGAISMSPCGEHLFGTDTLGRDLFSIIWYGGRISLIVGLLATVISTFIAVIYGTASGLASDRIDDALMRLAEIILSIPQILLVLFLQALLGEANVLSIAFVIGITGWMAVAKMIRSEVRQLRTAGFVMAARTMGGGFFYILRTHLLPNCLSATMFMIVTNIGSAMATEATLSFLGLGLPTNIVSWGSLMALSQRAMLTDAWWILIIPGSFLVITLIAITEIGEYLRRIGKRDQII